jgi:hypothetical protein
MTRLPPVWVHDVKWSSSGASASSRSAWRASKREPARDALGPFPPELTVEIKALACGLPATWGVPLSRLSLADVARYAQRSGLVARISDSTGPVLASWLNQIEIYFSIVQRKALTPNDFTCLEAVAERLDGFERYYETIAHPFE